MMQNTCKYKIYKYIFNSPSALFNEEYLSSTRVTLQSKNLCKNYDTQVVKSLNLEMHSSQIFTLLGHNGSGKTTTISMLSGMLQKSSGQINYFPQ